MTATPQSMQHFLASFAGFWHEFGFVFSVAIPLHQHLSCYCWNYCCLLLLFDFCLPPQTLPLLSAPPAESCLRVFSSCCFCIFNYKCPAAFALPFACLLLFACFLRFQGISWRCAVLFLGSLFISRSREPVPVVRTILNPFPVSVFCLFFFFPALSGFAAVCASPFDVRTLENFTFCIAKFSQVSSGEKKEAKNFRIIDKC